MPVIVVENKESGKVIMYIPACLKCAIHMDPTRDSMALAQGGDTFTPISFIAKLNFVCPNCGSKEFTSQEQLDVINRYPMEMQETKKLPLPGIRQREKKKKNGR